MYLIWHGKHLKRGWKTGFKAIICLHEWKSKRYNFGSSKKIKTEGNRTDNSSFLIDYKYQDDKWQLIALGTFQPKNCQCVKCFDEKRRSSVSFRKHPYQVTSTILEMDLRSHQMISFFFLLKRKSFLSKKKEKKLFLRPQMLS